jgi:hypothetical protein
MRQNDPSDVVSSLDDRSPVLRTTRVVQIIALVKPFRAQAVLDALGSNAILSGTVKETMRNGRQKKRLHQYRQRV